MKFYSYLPSQATSNAWVGISNRVQKNVIAQVGDRVFDVGERLMFTVLDEVEDHLIEKINR